MSNSNDIKNFLAIKDDCISIVNVEVHKKNGETLFMVNGVLTMDVLHCPNCNFPVSSDGKIMIVKNGKKPSRILMCDSAKQKVILNLQKQRFYCRHCSSHFTCSSTIVDRHCFISKQVKFSILEELAEKVSASYIARKHHVSWSTVQRVIESLHPHLKRYKECLPTSLMVDEFRSLKSMDGKMSFICADGDSGELLDVLPSRRLKDIENHFLSYTLTARKQVQYLVTDMNAPYFELAKRCFPNAKVIVDRFHIVQHINRSFNNVRIRIMKSFSKNNPAQSKQYHQLKSLNRLLLKRADLLDAVIRKKRRNYSWAYLTETDVVHRLLAISPELKVAYHYYQLLLKAFKDKDSKTFFHHIDHMPLNLSCELRHIKYAFTKYRKAICFAMELGYSNGKIESKNTHIKTLKRVCYGFRSFNNMKVRIFLINNLIRFKKHQPKEKSTKMIA